MNKIISRGFRLTKSLDDRIIIAISKSKSLHTYSAFVKKALLEYLKKLDSVN